jgi:hypothetical protein
MIRRRRLSMVVVLLGALASTPALAQQADASQRALKLAYEADELYARGKWTEAYLRFEAANGLVH